MPKELRAHTVRHRKAIRCEKLNITIPGELSMRLERHRQVPHVKQHLCLSKICAEAIRKRLDWIEYELPVQASMVSASL